MKAIHGGKAKNDTIDSLKIASLLRGGMIPMAYVNPHAMRATRDLLRRRLSLVRKRGQLFAHVQNTHHQYNHPEPSRTIIYRSNRDGVADKFDDPAVRTSVAIDLNDGPAILGVTPSRALVTPSPPAAARVRKCSSAPGRPRTGSLSR
jgi:hypothetical protein